jgi:hypothetical protein
VKQILQCGTGAERLQALKWLCLHDAWFPSLTAVRTRFGPAVKANGLGSALVSTTKRWMASCRSTTDWKTPRLRRWRLSFAKTPSTALSQDAEVGVKWNV